MVKTIDMQLMRYMNLFARISRVTSKHCFIYNSTIMFVVQKKDVSLAMGPGNINLKKMNAIVNRKVKVVGAPQSLADAEKFISTIIHPIEIKSVELKDNYLMINAGQQSKAMLIGRNKKRFEEMKKIVKEYFSKELKIV